MTEEKKLELSTFIRYVNSKSKLPIINEVTDIREMEKISEILQYPMKENDNIYSIIEHYNSLINEWIRSKGMTYSWNDGILFCQLLESFGIQLKNYQSMKKLERLTYVSRIAQLKGIVSIISPEEIICCRDEKVISLYLMNYHAYEMKVLDEINNNKKQKIITDEDAIQLNNIDYESFDEDEYDEDELQIFDSSNDLFKEKRNQLNSILYGTSLSSTNSTHSSSSNSNQLNESNEIENNTNEMSLDDRNNEILKALNDNEFRKELILKKEEEFNTINNSIADLKEKIKTNKTNEIRSQIEYFEEESINHSTMNSTISNKLQMLQMFISEPELDEIIVENECIKREQLFFDIEITYKEYLLLHEMNNQNRKENCEQLREQYMNYSSTIVTLEREMKQLNEELKTLREAENREETLRQIAEEKKLLEPDPNVRNKIQIILDEETNTIQKVDEANKLDMKLKVFGASYDKLYFGSPHRFLQLSKWIKGCTKCSRIIDFNVVDRIDFRGLIKAKSSLLLLIHVDYCIFGSYVSLTVDSNGIANDRKFFVFTLLNTQNKIIQYVPKNYNKQNWKLFDKELYDEMLEIDGFFHLNKSGSYICEDFAKYYRNAKNLNDTIDPSIFCERVYPRKFKPTKICIYQFY